MLLIKQLVLLAAGSMSIYCRGLIPTATELILSGCRASARYPHGVRQHNKEDHSAFILNSYGIIFVEHSE